MGKILSKPSLRITFNNGVHNPSFKIVTPIKNTAIFGIIELITTTPLVLLGTENRLFMDPHCDTLGCITFDAFNVTSKSGGTRATRATC